MCVLAPQTCAAVHGRAQKGCCLFVMISMPPCIETAHSLCRTGLCGPSKIFRVFVVKSGFPGLLVSAEPRKMRAVAQKLRRVWLHILFCALADGLWVRPFLKSTHTLTLAGWAGAGGLGAALRSLVSPQRRITACVDVCLMCTDALGGCSPFQE